MLWRTVGIGLAALAVGAAGAWRVQEWRFGAIEGERLAAAAEATRLRQQAQAIAIERNDRETSQAMARARDAALVARGDLERLRIAAGGAGAAQDPAPSCGDDGRLGQLARLLAEGAGLVEEGGRRVEQLAAEKSALQRHATEER